MLKNEIEIDKNKNIDWKKNTKKEKKNIIPTNNVI